MDTITLSDAETTDADTEEEQENMDHNSSASSSSSDESPEIPLVEHNINPDNESLVNESRRVSDLFEDDSIPYESYTTDWSDIREDFIRLKDDQRDIVMHIFYLYKNIQRDDSGEILNDSPKIILQGPAGSGKSTVINFIEKCMTWGGNKTSDSSPKKKVLKCAFTGKAAANIDGLTLHSTFSIPINKFTELTKERLASTKEHLTDCIFFICDEISMVGKIVMRKVDMRLRQIFENNNLYANRFVLLSGDLYQIDPVRDKPMYPDSEYWKHCEFYELTEIKRQENVKFINALNNFRNCQMTEEDISLLKSREIQNIKDVPDSVIHLFYLNADVDEHNSKKIKQSRGKKEIVDSIERQKETGTFELTVKVGLRYLIASNIDVGDGLANGTTGIVKDFDYDDEDRVSAIWMEFHSKKIGKSARNSYLNNEDRPGFENWVPIQTSKFSRKKFPLKAAEAITVHKSQGQTYEDGVCIHFTTHSYDRLRTDKSLQYVALTRVKRIEDLYIDGSFDYSDITNSKLTRTTNEINRLREEKKLELAFETFDNRTGDVIVYLNAQKSSFYENYQFITCDKWYQNASLLIFSETNTIERDKITIPNFQIAFESYADDSRSSGGIICYKKANKSLKLIDTLQVDNVNRLTLFLYENVFIIAGVKGGINDEDFKLAIKNFFSAHIREERCIFFIGDYDMKSNILTSFNLKEVLSCEIMTTNKDSHYDVVFSTRNFAVRQNHNGFYQYIPSSHKPIYVILPPESPISSPPAHLKARAHNTHTQLAARFEAPTHKTHTQLATPFEAPTNNTHIHLAAPFEASTHNTYTQQDVSLEEPTNNTPTQLAAPFEAPTHNTYTQQDVSLEDPTNNTHTQLAAPFEASTHNTHTQQTVGLEKPANNTHPQITAPSEADHPIRDMSSAEMKPTSAHAVTGEKSGEESAKHQAQDCMYVPNKRQHQEWLTTPESTAKCIKKAKNIQQEDLLSYVDAIRTNDLYVAVLTEPYMDLTAEQAMLVKDALEGRLKEMIYLAPSSRAGELPPSFRGEAIHSEGVLKLRCEDDLALRWLTKQVSTLPSPLPGTVLVVKRQAEIPKKEKAYAFIPDYFGSVDKLKWALDSQNQRWLNVNSWTFYAATQEIEGPKRGTRLILGIPDAEVPRVDARQRRLSFCMGNVNVSFHGEPGLEHPDELP